jgi:hypothetical protein
MSRYSNTPIIQTDSSPRKYTNVKYPNISRSQDDIYVYVSQGDRYDILSQNYYQNPDLWWIISRANPTHPFDSLYPTPGLQLRIPSPSRIPGIQSDFSNINKQ